MDAQGCSSVPGPHVCFPEMILSPSSISLLPLVLITPESAIFGPGLFLELQTLCTDMLADVIIR